MDNKIEIFNNPEFGKIRVCGTNNEPLFCLADLCRALDIKNVSDCKSRLNSKGIVITDTLTNGGRQSLIFVDEGNMYKCIFQSRKEDAEQFQYWVTNKILPSIRKHGVYATDETIDKIIANPDFGIKLLTELKEEREKRVESERQNAILMHVNKTYTSTEIAKECNLKSANELNKLLNAKGVQFKSGGTWVLYSKYANLGYEEIKQEVLDNGRVIYHRKFTQIGRKFILNLLKNQKTIE